MKDGNTPRSQEGEPLTKGGKDTARRLEQKAHGQRGEANPDRTREKHAARA